VHTIDLNDTAPESVPAEVIGEAKAVFGERAKTEMAILVWDSMLDEGAPRGHHHLRFEHPQMWIEVSVSLTRDWSSLHGVMYPQAPLGVELHSQEIDTPLIADVTRHAFRVEGVGHGLVRLRLVGPELAPAISTEWFHV
jgi:hypothetical protein